MDISWYPHGPLPLAGVKVSLRGEFAIRWELKGLNVRRLGKIVT